MDPDLHPTPTALLARTRRVHAIRTAADAELVQLAARLGRRPPRPRPERPTSPPADHSLGTARHDQGRATPTTTR